MVNNEYFDRRELKLALDRLYDAEENLFSVIRHPTDWALENYHFQRPLLIIVHPGDVIDLISDWYDGDGHIIAGAAEIVQKSKDNQYGMAAELREMRETHDVLILHRSSSRFIEHGVPQFNEVIQSMEESAIVAFGGELEKAADWMIKNGVTADRPSIFMTGAYADDEGGCIAAIGRRLLDVNPSQVITVSEFSPDDGSEFSKRWVPGGQISVVYIVPAWSDQAGQCRIVARTVCDSVARTMDARDSYRDAAQLWQDVGLMSSVGKLRAFYGSREARQELLDCEPLCADTVFKFPVANVAQIMGKDTECSLSFERPRG